MSNKRKATGPSGGQQQAPERTRRDPEQLPPGVTPQDDEKRLLSRITLRKLVTDTLKVDLVRPRVYAGLSTAEHQTPPPCAHA
jgi:hypothetical protein